MPIARSCARTPEPRAATHAARTRGLAALGALAGVAGCAPAKLTSKQPAQIRQVAAQGNTPTPFPSATTIVGPPQGLASPTLSATAGAPPTIVTKVTATPAYTVVAAPKCAQDVTGLRRIRYKDAKIPYGGTCLSESQTASCTTDANGKDVVTWTGTYTATDCLSDGAVNCAGGIRHGEFQSRVRFKAAEAPFGQECASQRTERVCSNGAFSGWIPDDPSYAFDTCNVKAPRSCTWEGKALAHSAIVLSTRWRETQVEPGQTCVGEAKSLACHDGSVLDRTTGMPPVFTFTALTCHVRALRNCMGESGATVPSGGTETAYFYNVPNETPSSATKCELLSATRTCSDGTLSPWSRASTGFSTCQPLRTIAVKVRAEQVSAQLVNCMAVSANGGDWVQLPCSNNTTGTPKVLETSASLPLWESQGNGTPLNHVCIRAWTEQNGTIHETRKVRVDGSRTAALTFNHEDKDNGDDDYDDYIIRIDTLGRTYLKDAGYGVECREAVKALLGR